MGCFPACFGRWRHEETMKNVQDQCLSPNESVKILKSTVESQKEEEIVNPIKLVLESEGKCDEQINKSNEETAVSDHSNLDKGTNVLTTTSSDDDKLMGNENEKEVVERERFINKDEGLESKISSFLINAQDRVALNSKEITLEYSSVREESSESLFSLSIDSRRQVFAVDMEDKEVNSPLKKICHHVLVKTVGKTSSKYDEDKENVPWSKDSMIKPSFGESKATSDDDQQLKKRESEIAVDTSLSSWLAASEKWALKKSTGSSPESEKNYGERQVLGAITSPAEFKELNEISSRGSTPCCSADDHPGIGTVGSYWQQRSRASGSSCRGVSTVCTLI